MIYLATPYSHDSPSVRQQRYETACAVVYHLQVKGITVYSPIVYWHPITSFHNLPLTAIYWKDVNFPALACAEELIICPMEGLETSEGVNFELTYALENSIPVSYVNEFGERIPS